MHPRATWPNAAHNGPSSDIGRKNKNSVPHGSVTLTGSIGPKGGKEVFTFRWIERNGPEVKIPTRRGFGSTVLIDAAKAFGARSHIDYATEGLRYELALASVQSSDD